ncbi:MAG TPA: hypothetical protein PKH24_21660, partial [Sedimentisphaerales bacterium]|nr:hypothetical protein [Sedimentisphaerales bacterium]HNU31892.1 hypothetical protein [Sedimentisphaerales bacterium]
MQFQTKLSNSVQVRGLARIPLMLGLLCKACPEGSFPAKRSDLYESCLRGLLRDWHIDDRKPSQGKRIESERSCEYVDALMEVLGEISLRLLDERQEQFSESKLREILERWLKSDRCSSEFSGGRASSSELIGRFKADGILVKSRSDEVSVRSTPFLRGSVRYHFC